MAAMHNSCSWLAQLDWFVLSRDRNMASKSPDGLIKSDDEPLLGGSTSVGMNETDGERGAKTDRSQKVELCCF